MFDDADQFLKIAVALGVLSAGAGVGYHFGIYLPEFERQKIERAEKTEKRVQQRAEQIERQREQRALKIQAERKLRYNYCLISASDNYNINWKNACSIKGVDNKGKNCSLPTSSAEYWGKQYKYEQQRCLDEFKSII
jgi:hypothetical protein